MRETYVCSLFLTMNVTGATLPIEKDIEVWY